ncbi:MAG: tyrosine-type recombinase/integrase [Bryobacteraceae bacterium]
MPKGERGTAKPYLRGTIWWVKYYVPGETQPRRESSGSTNKQDAVRLLNKRRKEIDDRKVSSSTATVNDLLKLYLDDQKRQKRHSYRSAEGFVRLHLNPAFGLIRAATLGTKHVKAFIEQKQTAGYANASINRWLEALRRGYTLGLQELPPLVYAAPDIESLMLEEDNVREGFLEHAQYVALRDELPDHQRLILAIGYHLAMRRGEILKLRWDQVDWNENLIRLEKRQTKAKKARIAPLYGELRAWLDMAYAGRDPECPYIISWRGHGLSEVKTAWKNACRRAGVPDLLVHDLRRTAARTMIRAGIPEKQIMLIAGWKTRSMFDRYHIVDERDIQEAGKKLALHLAQQECLVKEGTKEGTAELSGGVSEIGQMESIQ